MTLAIGELVRQEKTKCGHISTPKYLLNFIVQLQQQKRKRKVNWESFRGKTPNFALFTVVQCATETKKVT